MKKTILSHFYNEEYLLPFWLNHHKKYFDHGIMINYGSTDSSVDIIKEICPNWEILDTRYEYFYAPWVEEEIVELEKNIEGWRMVVNTTEFLFGNYDLLTDTYVNTQYLISSHVMVDTTEQEFTEIKEDLFKERQFGLHRHNHFGIRSARSLHNYLINYPEVTGPGRHFITPTCPCEGQRVTEDFFILWYGFSPFTEKLIDRKLQIQTKNLPNGGWTGGHDINRDTLIGIFKSYQSKVEDLSEEINKFL